MGWTRFDSAGFDSPPSRKTPPFDAGEEQDAPGAPRDEVFRELWDRVSSLRSAEVETDRITARNWRLGEERKMAAVELEDTRVCQTRLKGRTVAFGTAAGAGVPSVSTAWAHDAQTLHNSVAE